VVLQDIWEPAKAAQISREKGDLHHGLHPFLSDLARVVAESGQPVPTLKTFLCAGAPIPGPLVEQARSAGRQDRVGLGHDRERRRHPDPLGGCDDAVHTDGLPLPGVEIKVVDIDGRSLPAGTTGQLCCAPAPTLAAT
jgi:cyclohexanecarboxylate-CoA ligase